MYHIGMGGVHIRITVEHSKEVLVCLITAQYLYFRQFIPQYYLIKEFLKKCVFYNLLLFTAIL